MKVFLGFVAVLLLGVAGFGVYEWWNTPPCLSPLGREISRRLDHPDVFHCAEYGTYADGILKVEGMQYESFGPNFYVDGESTCSALSRGETAHLRNKAQHVFRERMAVARRVHEEAEQRMADRKALSLIKEKYP